METIPTTKKQRKKKRDDDDDKKRVKKQRCAETDTTTEWNKMIKLQNTERKATTTTTTTTKKKTKKKTTVAEKKKKNSFKKHTEPVDLMFNASHAQKTEAVIQTYETIDATNHEQKPLAIHVMPAREHQTIETLALSPAAACTHLVLNDLDFAMAMKKSNFERHQAAAASTTAAAETIRPLECLMTDGGFMAVDQTNVEPIFIGLSKEIRQNINFINATKSDTQSRRKKRTVKHAEGEEEEDDDDEKKQKPPVKRLNLIFGNTYHSFGYHKRTSQPQSIKALEESDRFDRFKTFFRDDQLEEETNFGEVARNFKMFRELCAKNMEKYKRRAETQRDTATLVPKTTLEEVTKEYIRKFREPPGKNDELCANGDECVFNTFSEDKNVRYIGKVFYTEQEKRRRLEAQLAAARRRQARQDRLLHGPPSSMMEVEEEAEEDDSHTYNKHKLCIECLLRLWTKIYFRNIADEVIPEHPINYFSVICGRGQYSPKAMLNVIENKRPTGIMGHVPRFAINKRCLVTLEATVTENGKAHTIFVPSLAETGMDF